MAIKINSELYSIEIESRGKYETKKEYNTQTYLTERQYLELVAVVLDYLDTLTPPTQDGGISSSADTAGGGD